MISHFSIDMKSLLLSVGPIGLLCFEGDACVKGAYGRVVLRAILGSGISA